MLVKGTLGRSLRRSWMFPWTSKETSSLRRESKAASSPVETRVSAVKLRAPSTGRTSSTRPPGSSVTSRPFSLSRMWISPASSTVKELGPRGASSSRPGKMPMPFSWGPTSTRACSSFRKRRGSRAVKAGRGGWVREPGGRRRGTGRTGWVAPAGWAQASGPSSAPAISSASAGTEWIRRVMPRSSRDGSARPPATREPQAPRAPPSTTAGLPLFGKVEPGSARKRLRFVDARISEGTLPLMDYVPPKDTLEVLQQIRYEESLGPGDPRYVDTREARGSQRTLQRLARKFGLSLSDGRFFPPTLKHVLFFG